MAVLLGGSAWPVGWTVGFVERPYSEVVEATADWSREERFAVRKLRPGSLAQRLAHLEPLQTPPKRELLVPVGTSWTAQVVNCLLGGDSVSWVGHLTSELSCHGVLATHVPVGQYPFPATQFEYLGPEGEPPLHYIRTVTAGIFDSGRWLFEAHGAQLHFEETAAYQERRKRDRFTRPMLVRYLAALGIPVDEPSRYGVAGTLFESRARYKPRTLTVEQARAEYATRAPAPFAG
jgi:hypothetical protein